MAVADFFPYKTYVRKLEKAVVSRIEKRVINGKELMYMIICH